MATWGTEHAARPGRTRAAGFASTPYSHSPAVAGMGCNSGFITLRVLDHTDHLKI